MALLAISLLMKDGNLLFPFLSGLLYQILSITPVCCWISQFSATWGTLSRTTQPSCGAAHPMHLLLMMEHSKPLVSKLALPLDPALLFSIYTSIFQLNNVFCNLCSVPSSFFPPKLYGQNKMKVKEREFSIAYEAINLCIPVSITASLQSFSQPSLVFLILAQAVVSPCSVLLRSKLQLWAMQNLFLKISWDYWES